MDLSDRTVDEYLGSLSEQVGEDMAALDAVIAAEMDGFPRELYEGKLWGGSDQEIIGYGRYSYQRSDNKTVEWFLIGLAAQKNYLSVYISAVEDGEYMSEKYGSDLGKVKVGKSSISFKAAADIDLAKLASLVRRARASAT